MKKNVRKALAISGLAIAIGTSGLTLEASARTNSSHWQRSHQERILRTRKFENRAHARRLIAGTVTAIEGNSLTIKRGPKDYTVSITPSTKILNHNWNSLSLSNMKIGDKIRVSGTISDSTIIAKTIRNISIQ